MSKHNYSQYSNKNNNGNKQSYQHKHRDKVEQVETTVPDVKMEVKPQLVQETSQVVQPKPQLVQETVETVALPDRVIGKVVDCAKLNVRENCTVDSGIVCVLDVRSEIEIDVKKSTDHWYYIYTAIGAEGYCMKQYVEARM